MSPEVYRLLVLDRSWKSERYERWLTGTLIDQLLCRPALDPVGPADPHLDGRGVVHERGALRFGECGGPDGAARDRGGRARGGAR